MADHKTDDFELDAYGLISIDPILGAADLPADDELIFDEPTHPDKGYEASYEAEQDDEDSNPEPPLTPQEVFDKTSGQDEHPMVMFANWDVLAYDIVSDTASLEQILDSYEVTEEGFRRTVKHPHFIKMLQLKKDEILSLGGSAHFVNQAKVLSSIGLSEIANRIKTKATKDSDLLRMVSAAVGWARLEPDTGSGGGSAGSINVGSGSSVQFIIEGVPGLSHLQPSLGAKKSDVMKEATDADYEDV